MATSSVLAEHSIVLWYGLKKNCCTAGAAEAVQGKSRMARPVGRASGRGKSARRYWRFFSRFLHVRFGCILRGERAEARLGGGIVDSTRDPATSRRFGSKFR